MTIGVAVAVAFLVLAAPSAVLADDRVTSEARTTPPASRDQNDHLTPSVAVTVDVLPGAPEEETEQDEISIPVMDALRARITGGAIFFNESVLVRNETNGTAQYESPQFSTASTYLAFEAQPRLWPMAERTSRESHSRVYFEGIANVRLTTIGATGSDESIGTSGIAPPGASVLKSQKSAQLQFGALMSINGRGFHVRHTRFHWGFGPVYRAMLQTVTNAQRNRRVWNAEDDLYDAHTVGVRFTLYSRPGNSSSTGSWTPTAYIDFTRGLFQNFELVHGNSDAAQECLRMPSGCLASGVPPTGEFAVDKKWRTYVEGRVFVGSIYLGFNLNNGRGPDDVRFLAGFTLDVSRYFAGGTN